MASFRTHRIIGFVPVVAGALLIGAAAAAAAPNLNSTVVAPSIRPMSTTTQLSTPPHVPDPWRPRPTSITDEMFGPATHHGHRGDMRVFRP